ncbi:MAG TPA: hypothetical protein VJV78_28295 [Polyangiales bacterium]|nr:hypothetical protein [Polyangiales bacterium]
MPLAVAALLLTSAVIAWPMYSHEGVYYLDNPSHIAEVISLAQAGATGWSDIAICGFPLAALHSPLWYGLLAWIARLGVPAEIPYLALLGVSFVLPALAVLYVMQRRMPLWAAFALAYGLLVFRGAAIGSMAAFGGMFTFYIACAALILLADRLARPERGWLDVAAIAGLTGMVGISHTYVTVGVVGLALVHAGFVIRSGRGWPRVLLHDALAFALGGLAAARYVLVAMASGASSFAGTENLDAASVMRRLIAGYGVVPSATTALGRLLEHKTLYTDSLLQIALMGLGVLAARRSFRERTRDRFAAVGLVLAGLLLVLLLVVLPGSTLRILGPQSFRLTYVAKLGLVFAAAPLMAAVARRWPLRPRGFALACALCVASGFWWQRSVTQVLPDAGEVRELEAFWSHMRDLVQPGWGRVYVQDTFDTPGTGTLFASHATALTAARTGVTQLGAHYGVMPFATRPWTNSERGALFGADFAAPGALDHVVAGMRRTSSTHLLSVDPHTARRVAADPRFRSLLEHGPYALFALDGAASQPVIASPGVQLLKSQRLAPGQLVVQYASPRPAGSLQLREAYSPFWQLSPRGVGRIESNDDGLMSVTGLRAGTQELRLRVALPVWPAWISALSWLCIFALALAASRRAGSQPLAASALTP